MRDPDKDPMTFWQVLLSVLAAAFGVQSEKNRQRDFSRGRPIHFVLVGVLATLLFIVLLYGLVRLVLGLALG